MKLDHNAMRTLVFAVPISLVLLAAAGSLFLYPGNPWMLAAFHLSFFALAVLAILRPRIDAFFFLAGFMTLGFWLKFMTHLFIGYPFVEPVGDFDYSPAQWDMVLSAATVATIGAALFRGGYLLVVRGRVSAQMPVSTAPEWYRQRPIATWAITAVLTLALYVVNYHFAFFQVGVNHKIRLPPGMNAILAWTVYSGAPLAWAWLTGWEIARSPDRFSPLVWSVCLLAVVASVSMASRATTVFLFAAYASALALHMPATLKRLVLTWRWRLPFILAVTLALSLVLVSAFRMNTYAIGDRYAEQGRRRATETLGANMSEFAMLKQVLSLPVDRWVGLEGMLAVSGSLDRSLSLLVAGIRESPKKGVDSIYQKLSNSPYKFQSGFTYLTLPGGPAILFYGGSLLVVMAGMFFFAAVLTVVEILAAKVTGSPFLVAVLGLLMANAVSEMSFPYLWFVFVVEMIVALCAVGFLRYLPVVLRRHSGRARAQYRPPRVSEGS